MNIVKDKLINDIAIEWLEHIKKYENEYTIEEIILGTNKGISFLIFEINKEKRLF